MNRISKTTKRALTGQTIVVSKLAKGQAKSQSAFTTKPKHLCSKIPRTPFLGALLTCCIIFSINAAYADGEMVIYSDTEGDLQQLGSMIYPGTPSNPSANNNTVIIDYTIRTNPDMVLGGYSNTGSSSGNTVILRNGNVSDTNSNIYGGYTTNSFGDSFNNTVHIEGGNVGRYVIGSRGNTTYDNNVIMSGGSVGSLVGGESNTGDSYGHSVTINGGSVDGRYLFMALTGGWANNYAVYNNIVHLNGGTISGNIYAGYSYNQVYDNTVYIRNNPNLTNASIYAAKTATTTVYGNILNFEAEPITLQNMGGFEYYNFTIPASAINGTALITATGTVDVNNAHVEVKAITSGSPLMAGDTIALIDATTLNGTAITVDSEIHQGFSLIYDVDVEQNGNQITATIVNRQGNEYPPDPLNPPDPSKPAHVNPQTKALSEGYLAGAMLVSRGADLIADDAFNTISIQNGQNGLTPFVMLSGSHTRYNSGSHINSNDFLLDGGLSYQQNGLTTAAFIEAGWGSYDSYNSFYNAASVKGDGNNRYMGIGLLGRYDFENGFYTDASLRFGRNRNKFDTNDIQNIATGQYANYTLTSSYVSAHIGVGYLLSINDTNQLDLSAKYLYSTLEGKNVDVAGDPIHFERVNSHRARINATLNHRYSNTVTLNAGLGYEHEFDSKARATTYNIYSINAPSVRGATGILSFGASIVPSTNQNLNLDFKLNGYTGKREGVGANIRVSYAF